MKHIYLIFLVAFLGGLSLNAQTDLNNIDFFKEKADSLFYSHQYEDAGNAIIKVIEIAKRNSSTKELGDALVRYGRILKSQGNYDDAERMYSRALGIRTQLHDTCGTYSIYNNLSSIAETSKGALLHAKRAANSNAEKACENTYPYFLSTLANAYEDLGELDSAILVSQKAIISASKSGNTKAELIARYGLAKRFFVKGEFDEVQISLNIIIDRFSNTNNFDDFFFAQVYELAGVNSFEKGEVELSYSYFNKANSIYSKHPNKRMIMAQTYFNKGNRLINSEQVELARKFYQKAESIISLNQDEIEIHGFSYNADFRSALKSQLALIDIQEKEERLNKILEISLTIMCLFALVVATLSFLIYKKEKKSANLSRENHRLKHDLVKNNLKAINNNIEYYLEDTDSWKDSKELLSFVSQQLDELMFKIGFPQKTRSLETSLKAFSSKMYNKVRRVTVAKVENYSYLDEVEDYDIPHELSTELDAIITEVFVNIQDHANCKNASIEFVIDEEGLTIIIEDDGVGFDIKNTNSGSGFKNIRQRVHSINGEFIQNSSLGEGTQTKIIIPDFPHKVSSSK